MPINGLWTIRMAVTRRMPEDTAGEPVVLRGKDSKNDTAMSNKSDAEADGPFADSGGGEEFDHDPTDWVSVRMGPSLSSLHHVADVKNVVNDDLGEVKALLFLLFFFKELGRIYCIRGQWEKKRSVCGIVVESPLLGSRREWATGDDRSFRFTPACYVLCLQQLSPRSSSNYQGNHRTICLTRCGTR